MKHMKRNLFIVLQISFLLLALVVTVTILSEEYNRYRPVAALNGEKGFAIDAYGYHGESAEQIAQNMQKVKSVISWGYGGFNISQDNRYCIAFAYPENLLSDYVPELQSGSWLDTSQTGEGGMDIVVSENPYGWKEGSQVELNYYDENAQVHSVRAFVRGVLEEGTEIIGAGIGVSRKIHGDYRDLYSTYRYEQLEDILILMSEGQVKKQGIPMTYNQTHFVIYDEDITKAQMAANERRLKETLGAGTESTSILHDLTEFMDNSNFEMQKKIFLYVPVLVCVLLVTVISLVNVCTLNLADDIPQNAVYCILGLPWRKNSLFSLIQSAITAVMSMVLACFFLLIIQRTALNAYIYARLDGLTVFSVLLILVILCLFHYLSAVWIIRRNKPVELLKNTL
ncbi:MAG: hypothetical protein J1F02_05355 [Lachnospiraceae bacterium]|nr:hypothetical protein [Lachnospiraceae bacterium]